MAVNIYDRSVNYNTTFKGKNELKSIHIRIITNTFVKYTNSMPQFFVIYIRTVLRVPVLQLETFGTVPSAVHATHLTVFDCVLRE